LLLRKAEGGESGRSQPTLEEVALGKRRLDSVDSNDLSAELQIVSRESTPKGSPKINFGGGGGSGIPPLPKAAFVASLPAIPERPVVPSKIPEIANYRGIVETLGPVTDEDMRRLEAVKSANNSPAKNVPANPLLSGFLNYPPARSDAEVADLLSK
jgi:hypothetical protein